MSTSPSIRVIPADWNLDADRIRAIRTKVFVEEQGVSVDVEQDGKDPVSWHVVAVDERGTAVGTGRLMPDGHIGRLAVVRELRGLGIGAGMLEALVAIAAAQGIREIALNAQAHAVPFYEGHGFQVRGDLFYEAEIPHRRMVRVNHSDAPFP
jgi:predicted GNAT family N-acyltransferase